MAELYLGRTEGAAGFVRPVALKVVHAHLVQDATYARMLTREARVVATLDHPNIVPVHELAFRDDELFFTMKRVSGRTLTQWVGDLPSIRRTREELLDLLDIDLESEQQVIDSHIKRIRKKFKGAHPEEKFNRIHTYYGVGYAWHPQSVANHL